MPVVNPGIRRYIGSAIQRLFNSASFSAPLTHSLTLERGTGTPTFTRATTATGQKWDEAGYLDFTALAGEAIFKGARRERNWIQAPTENWSSAGWGKSGISVSGNRLTATGANGVIYDNAALSMGTSRTAVGSVTLSRVTGTGNIDVSTNGGTTWTTVSVTGARVSVSLTGNINGQFAIRIVTSGDAVDATYPQLEDVTGQTTQTASEYVSVGVESAPAYHGSMVDGVKCYDTDRSGNPISTTGSYPLVGYVPWEARTNLCLQSNAFTTTWLDAASTAATQNVVGPDGATSAWTLTDNNAGVREFIYQSITLTAATYTWSIFVKKTTGAQSSYPVLFAYPALTSLAAVTIDTSNGVATPWTAYTGYSGVSCTATCVSFNTDYWRVAVTFTGTAAAWEFDLYPAATSNATQSTGTINVAATGSAVFYGAQLELGSAATSYIPTTTVAVARNADVESVPTSGNIIAASGWIALTYTPTHAPSGTVFLWGTYVDASNYTAILHDATNLIFRKRIAGTNYDATIANAFVSGTTYKMAATWGASGTGIALNGTLGTGHANTTAAQIGTAMQTGADGNGANQPGMSLGNERIGQRQLSSSELQAITR